MKIKVSSLVFALLFIFAFIMAGCSRPTMQQRMNFMVDRISQRLSLTPDQQTNLIQIKDGFFSRLKSQQDQRGELGDEFVALIKSDTIDTNKLNDIKLKMKDLNGDLGDYVTRSLVDFHKTLTPEQREKVADWLEKINKKMKEMM